MSFWYLATPYSKYHAGIETAFVLAAQTAASLVRAGIPVYSPIAHTHPIAVHGQIDPLDHGIWLPADEPFMRAACGLIVLCAQGWKESRGIAHEIEQFAGRPIVYMDPGTIPELPDLTANAAKRDAA
jgi:hypothetical protein